MKSSFTVQNWFQEPPSAKADRMHAYCGTATSRLLAAAAGSVVSDFYIPPNITFNMFPELANTQAACL